MEYSRIAFFCNKGDGPIVSQMDDEGISFPFFIRIESAGRDAGNIDIYLTDESDVIKFKNSVINAYEQMRRR